MKKSALPATLSVLHINRAAREANMQKNVTLRLNEALLRKARLLAVDRNRSLSAWMTELLEEAVAREDRFAHARQRALKRLERGFALGGKPLSREALHD